MSAAAARLEAMIALAGHPRTPDAEAEAALVGAQKVLDGHPELAAQYDTRLMIATVSVAARRMIRSLEAMAPAIEEIRRKVRDAGL